MSIFITPRSSAFGQNVRPPAGAKWYFFEAGTTTPKPSYTTNDETVAQSHPVVADGNGLFAAIYISGVYKARLTDADDVQIYEEDNLQGPGSGLAIQTSTFDSNTNGGDYPLTGSLGTAYIVSETFTTNAQSGSNKLKDGDMIYANKAGATDIDADWNIIRGVISNIGSSSLTAAASISTDCSKGTVFPVTLDQNSTLANPTEKTIGQTYTWVITQDATGSRTLAYGTDFDFIGDSFINPEASSVTVIKGTVTSSTNIKCEILTGQERSASIEYTDLIAKYVSATTVDVDIRKLKLLDENNNSIVVENIDLTLDITDSATRYGGVELASHWYQIFLHCDSDKDVSGALVPDLTGTATSDVANKLVDASADFVTYKVTVGSIAYNHDDNTSGIVTAVDDLNTLSFDTDLFPDGNESYTIHIVEPVLNGSFKANISAVYNDSGSNFDDFHQTDNKVALQDTLILSGGAATSYTSLSLSAVIPISAKKANGSGRADDNDGNGAAQLDLASKSSGIGYKKVQINTLNANAIIEIPVDLIILEPQRIYYKISSGDRANIRISNYCY